MEINFKVLTLLISIIGIYLVIRQLRVTTRINEESSSRQLKETTLSAYESVRVDMRVKKDSLTGLFNINKDKLEISESDVDIIFNNNDLKEKVNSILDYLNRFAIGVNYDIYDFDILNELSGIQFCKTYDRFFPYISRLREKVSPKLYSSLDSFIDRIKNEEG